VKAFLTLLEHEYAHLLSDNHYMAKLADLSDIFVHLSELKGNFQGKNTNILNIMDKSEVVAITHRQ
jgi:hypothetical protein